MLIAKNKKVAGIICALIVIIAVAAFAFAKVSKVDKYGAEGHSVITEKSLAEVSEVLRQAQLSNVDLFETWVYEYFENEDITAAAYSDADSKIIAMLLADDQISCKDAKEYKGEYLRDDVGRIEREDTFMFIRDNLPVFTTLFGETDIPKSGIKDALPENWKKHDIRFINDKSTLVSLVTKVPEKDEVVVAHAGILIDCSDMVDTGIKSKYLFVEKIASNDAFHASEIDAPEELIDIFSGREENKTGDGEPNSLVYMNDKYLGELK